MSDPLEAWKQFYGISDDAHLHLLVILQRYGIGTAIESSGHAPDHPVATTDQVVHDLQSGPMVPFERPHYGSENCLPQHSRIEGEASQVLFPTYPSGAYTHGENINAASQKPCARCWMRKIKVFFAVV